MNSFVEAAELSLEMEYLRGVAGTSKYKLSLDGGFEEFISQCFDS